MSLKIPKVMTQEPLKKSMKEHEKMLDKHFKKGEVKKTVNKHDDDDGETKSNKKMKLNKKEEEEEEETYQLYFDGECVGNGTKNAQCGCAYMIKNYEDKKICCGFKYLGYGSKSIAEYNGLENGLKLAISKGITNLVVKADNELLIKQMKGECKLDKKFLKDIHERTKKLLSSFKNITFVHVHKNMNDETDTLANRAISKKSSTVI